MVGFACPTRAENFLFQDSTTLFVRYVVTQVVRFTVQSLRVKTVDHIPDQFTDQIPDRSHVVMSSHTVVLYEIMPMVIHDVSRSYVSRDSIR